MSKGQFRKYLEQNGLYEDDAGNSGTSSGDIASYTSKLDLVGRTKHLEKGKKCSRHGVRNCQKCADEAENGKWK